MSIPACASSSPAFLKMYSAYKLNKQGDTIEPWHTPYPIWNQSVVPCPVLPVTSWHAYKFLKRQVRWSGIPISFRHCSLLQRHSNWSTSSYRNHCLHLFFVFKLCFVCLCWTTSLSMSLASFLKNSLILRTVASCRTQRVIRPPTLPWLNIEKNHMYNIKYLQHWESKYVGKQQGKMAPGL